MRFPTNGSGPWQVRVVANKFAALSPDVQPTRTIHRSRRSMGGFGVHDVIIDTPDHSHSSPPCRKRTWPTCCASTSLATMP